MPPIADEVLRLYSFDFDNVEHHSQILAADPDAIAVVQFSVHRKFITEFLDLKAGGPWAFPADKISDLNREIRGLIEIVTREP